MECGVLIHTYPTKVWEVCSMLCVYKSCWQLQCVFEISTIGFSMSSCDNLQQSQSVFRQWLSCWLTSSQTSQRSVHSMVDIPVSHDSAPDLYRGWQLFIIADGPWVETLSPAAAKFVSASARTITTPSSLRTWICGGSMCAQLRLPRDSWVIQCRHYVMFLFLLLAQLSHMVSDMEPPSVFIVD